VGNLAIEDCTVRNFPAGGIFINARVNTNLYVHACTVRGCSTGLEIVSVEAPGVRAFATVSNCRLEANSSDCVIATSSFPNGAVDLTLSNCIISGNGGDGVAARGSATAVVRVSDCTITGNNLGVTTDAGGQLLSRGNNTLENNAGGNTFPAAYSAK